MKLTALLRHLFHHGCSILREGGKHTVVLNTLTQRISSVPRHNEIDEFLAKKICRDLGIENS